MNLWKIIAEFMIILLGIFLFCCKPEEILLHGDISGYVTDAETSQPLQSAVLKLDPSDDTTSTGSDGKFLFKNLAPGNYEIEVSKTAYRKDIKIAKVESAKTTEIDFTLDKAPYPKISTTYLDFGFDSTVKSFTISNQGRGKFNYYLEENLDWLTVNPDEGEITTETDTIKVTIDRTSLSEKKHEEIIRIIATTENPIQVTVDVFLNGIMDNDTNYYGIVTIGTQTWMAENLNTGIEIGLSIEPLDNGDIEKYCYDCETYGGLYTWPEFMNYSPQDTGVTGTTQGICPDGWHIPTYKEWITLSDYAGGESYAGGKLKETGTTHWLPPNEGATDEYGFTALPGGTAARGPNPDPVPQHTRIVNAGQLAVFGTSVVGNPPDETGWPGDYWVFCMAYNRKHLFPQPQWYFYEATSIRCIKDP